VTLPFVDESDVSRRSTKRFFDTEFKRRVVAEYDGMEPYGPDRGSLLRREGLHRRQVHEWRKTVGMKSSDQPKRGRGRPRKQTVEASELDQLRARNLLLEAELVKKERVLQIMGKAHALLESLAESADTEPKPPRS
jgi:transposase